MFSVATLWIPFTITAALGQVARNAMQRQLTGPLGTWGATNIRFLFGFPFSLIFFAVVIAVTGDRIPWPIASFWPWLLLGALSQIVGTGMMLLAMNDRSFVVTTAYLKTEAIQTAIFGFVFLGDHLTLLKVIAILIATAGVVIAALRPGCCEGICGSEADAAGPRCRRGIRAVGGWLSRCGHRGARGVVRDGGLLYPGVRTVRADAGAVDLSSGARARRARENPGPVEALVVRRLHGGVRLAVLVSGVCAHGGRQRAHAGAGRGAVRASGGVLFVQAASVGPRTRWHRADRDWRGAAGGGVINSCRPAVPATARLRRPLRSGRALRPVTLRRRSDGARYRHSAFSALRWESARRHCRHSSRYDRAVRGAWRAARVPAPSAGASTLVW